jgi:hypothetical protein
MPPLKLAESHADINPTDLARGKRGCKRQARRCRRNRSQEIIFAASGAAGRNAQGHCLVVLLVFLSFW